VKAPSSSARTNSGIRSPLRTCLALAALTLTLGATACGSGNKSPFEPPTPEPEPIRLNVQNGLDLTVRIYALQGSSRVRIGTVPSHSRQSLSVPHHVTAGSGSLRLLASPVGSRLSYFTQEMMVSRGARVDWPIIPGLPHSQATIR
jgi:hypothetical protein